MGKKRTFLFSLLNIRKVASNGANIYTVVSAKTENALSPNITFFKRDHEPEEWLPRPLQQLYIFVNSYLLDMQQPTAKNLPPSARDSSQLFELGPAPTEVV